MPETDNLTETDDTPEVPEEPTPDGMMELAMIQGLLESMPEEALDQFIELILAEKQRRA